MGAVHPLRLDPLYLLRDQSRQCGAFSVTRGQPVGDVVLCERCRKEGKKCLFPVVARVKDTGMLHPDGYSVLIHTQANVSSVKNCYLMSGDVAPTADIRPPLRPFTGDAGRLFWQSTLLNGFDEVRDRGGHVGRVGKPLEGAAAHDLLALRVVEDLRSSGSRQSRARPR